MIENNPTNVEAAFEMLLEEIEAEIDFVTNIGSRSFEKRDFNRAREALEHAAKLTSFRDKTSLLRKEWIAINRLEVDEEEQAEHAERQNLGRLQRGMRTPEQAYYNPILEVLRDMGGSGKVSKVLDHVGKKMKNILKKWDYEPLASSPDNPRWRNAAQWARQSMIYEGLLKSDSSRGIWEITDKGYKFLLNQDTYTSKQINISDENLLFIFCKGSGTDAKGVYTENGLTVLTGSKCRLKETSSIPQTALDKRKELIKQKILVQEGNGYQFAKDYNFLPKPSISAQVVLGRSANGWTEWRNKDGQTLSSILGRKNV